MKKATALFLILVMLFSATVMAETVILGDYSFSITLPDGWVYEESELTEEHEEAGVVYGIDAYAEDKSIVMWLEIHSFDEESRPATEITVMEFEGYVTDWREYYQDMSLFAVNGVPFVYYTATDDDGTYLTAYTWTAFHEFGFIFFAEELTNEMRAIIDQIMNSYTTM